jgi:hypothetical protein
MRPSITQSDMLTLINPSARIAPFDDSNWIDGFRAAADTVRGRLISRNGHWLQCFKAVLDRLPKAHFLHVPTFVDQSKTSRSFSFCSSSRLIQRRAEGVKSRA